MTPDEVRSAVTQAGTRVSVTPAALTGEDK